eukprot:Gb_03671 [translate_table: standard]
MEGEVVCREKTNQVEQLSKFIRDDVTFCWLQSGITRESLPKPWHRVAIQVMKYPTLEGKYHKLIGYHIAILNSIRNNVKINMPLFLLKSPNAISSDLEEKKESPSEDAGGFVGKRYDRRKRKPAPQVLASSLAKCNRRSTILQKKIAEKVKIIDYVDTVDDEKEEKEVENPRDLGIKGKDLDHAEEDKDSTKVSCNTQNIIKELKSHLKILNALGGSMTSTCACLNVLMLKIANYLKIVVSRLKELNPERP